MKQIVISRKNDIAIPREACEALGLKPGDKVTIVVCSDRVLLVRRPRSYRKALRGLAKGVYLPDHLNKERNSWN